MKRMKAKEPKHGEQPAALASMIAASPIAAVISDPRRTDNPIVDCNQAFIDLTGYSRNEVLGRNCRFLAGPGTEDALTSALRNGIAARRPVMVEILNYKKDGTPFRNAVMVAPIFDAKGELEYFLGSQVEIRDSSIPQDSSRQKNALALIARLTPRQRETLEKLAAGKANKQIAFEMDITTRTVKMHIADLLRSLQLTTRADAIRIAIEAGM